MLAPKSPRTADETKVYGLNACAAIWQHRAAAIIRVYVTPERMREFGPLLKWCAKQKKTYHVLEATELERVAQSVHHEGVVFLTQAPLRLNDEQLLTRLPDLTGPQCNLFLDGVQNPHNVGSITRVAAHFGVPFILGPDRLLPRLTPAAARIAEGGMEHVTFVGLSDASGTLAQLQQHGFKIVVTSSHTTDSLYARPLPMRTVLILGGEVEGASPQALKLADEVRAIPGTGNVESLNVSVATGLCLGEFWRNHTTLKPPRIAR